MTLYAPTFFTVQHEKSEVISHLNCALIQCMNILQLPHADSRTSLENQRQSHGSVCSDISPNSERLSLATSWVLTDVRNAFAIKIQWQCHLEYGVPSHGSDIPISIVS